MRTVLPHTFFRLDFDQMLEEGKRQEEIHPANKGEYALVRNIHTYFDGAVLPLMISRIGYLKLPQDSPRTMQ